jgi:hypothetical protein
MKVLHRMPLRAAVLMTALAAAYTAGATQAAVKAAKPLGCSDAIKAAFKPDQLTTVIAVKAFNKGDPLVISEPVTPMTPKAANDLCLVKLNVGPGNPGPADAPSSSPGIGIEVWLPTRANWNERLHTTGGLGGFDGGKHGSTQAIGWTRAADTAGTEGAVSASTNSGHSQTDGTWAMQPDGTPNRQGWTDYAHRAQHEMALKTKALIKLYYGRPPKYSYYEGASTGGRHGYRLAQQYPGDYDGIVATLPAINWAEWTTAGFYQSLVTERDLGGTALTEGQEDLVSNAAIHACDVVGGQHLGYIFDNAACHYDPTQDKDVLCTAHGGDNSTPNCVSRVQANAINKFWYGITTDGSVPSPAVDNDVDAALTGKHLWYGLMRGTSLYVGYFARLAGVRNAAALAAGAAGGQRSLAAAGEGYGADTVALELQNPTIAGPSFRNASGDGQRLWKLLSYEQLANAFGRGLALNPVFGNLSSDNPDLSAFKSRGGKFLSWQGWNDETIPVQGTIRYYDRVIAQMGGVSNVQNFFKLYLVPGAGHVSPQGTSNPDANPPAVAGGQFYKLIVDWVENGVEPGRVELQSPSAKSVRITQPICPYPQKATYASGDPRVTTSFTCS